MLQDVATRTLQNRDGCYSEVDCALGTRGPAPRSVAWARGWACVATLALWHAGVAVAAAQTPGLHMSTVVVVPGTSSVVTVTGTPGYYFALLGSPKGAGFSYGGVAFEIGADG